MSLTDALSRTLLLMRTDLREEVDDDMLLRALTRLRVVVLGGEDALATHSGQTALVAAALTMARSGHEVWIDGSEVETIGAQPPLPPGPLLGALCSTGSNILPTRAIRLGRPHEADLAVTIGMAEPFAPAGRSIALDATDWSSRMARSPMAWSGGAWPAGGVAAGALAASEAFRTAMRSLACHARECGYFDELYAACDEVLVGLAPESTPRSACLGEFDFVSGGAIANAALFVLSRLPGVSGDGRVLDDDVSALSNLNRNALLLRSALDRPKVTDLGERCQGLIRRPEPVRYEAGMPLGRTVLVGVDDIPSRWAAQAAGPRWLGIGATEGFSVSVSSHADGQPCAGCLHPIAAAPTGPIPTAAFVSLLSGLLLAVRWQRSLGPEGLMLRDQQTFVNALRPESWSIGSMPLAAHPDCPVACPASLARRAA